MNVAEQGWMYDVTAKKLWIKVNKGGSNAMQIKVINKK